MTFLTYEDYIKHLQTREVSLEYFRKKGWKKSFQEKMGDKFDVIALEMPCAMNSKYSEWKIYFERYISLFDEEVIMIGHSLGAIFLTKYLSENTFTKKIKAIFLLAAPVGDIEGDPICDFLLIEKPRNNSKTFILHSEDDPIVPYAHALELKKLLPDAQLIMFKDKGHFNVPEFPELVELIKNL